MARKKPTVKQAEKYCIVAYASKEKRYYVTDFTLCDEVTEVNFGTNPKNSVIWDLANYEGIDDLMDSLKGTVSELREAFPALKFKRCHLISRKS